MPSAAAIAAAVQARRARLADRLAAGKKHCPRHDADAGAWLPLEEFNLARSTPDGRFGWCRSCTAKDKRESYAAAPAAEKARANAARRARIARRREQAEAQAAAAQAEAKAARVAYAVTVACDPRTSRDQLCAALQIVPASQLAAVARARVAAVRARVPGPAGEGSGVLRLDPRERPAARAALRPRRETHRGTQPRTLGTRERSERS